MGAWLRSVAIVVVVALIIKKTMQGTLKSPFVFICVVRTSSRSRLFVFRSASSHAAC